MDFLLDSMSFAGYFEEFWVDTCGSLRWRLRRSCFRMTCATARSPRHKSGSDTSCLGGFSPCFLFFCVILSLLRMMSRVV